MEKRAVESEWKRPVTVGQKLLSIPQIYKADFLLRLFDPMRITIETLSVHTYHRDVQY